MECELNSFESVRDFCSKLDEWRCNKPIDRLICNAGVYQPSLPYAKWSADGHEQTMQINYLSHFLMISLLMPDMVRARDPRIILVGSVTGNDNTVGGGGVYPIADLKELEGLKAGAKNPVRSRRPVVLWCLHFNTNRLRERRSGVVSFLILRPFDAPRRSPCLTATTSTGPRPTKTRSCAS